MRIFKRNNLLETVEIEIEIDPIVEVETIQETTIGKEAEIEEIRVEIELEVEIDLAQEMAEEIIKDLDQVKDTLTIKISATTVIEEVIQHTGVSNLKTT